MFLLLFLSIGLSVAVVSMDPIEEGNAAKETVAQLEKLKGAVSRYRENVGTNPPNLDVLLVRGAESACGLNVANAKLQGWCGPYLDQEFQGSDTYKRDGWRVLLQYNGTNIVSCGSNRACGDADDVSTSL